MIVRRSVIDCHNPDCPRYVSVTGLTCCAACRRALDDPERTLTHSATCDERLGVYLRELERQRRD